MFLRNIPVATFFEWRPIWRVATYHQPSAIECLYSTQALPDGNFVHRITDPPSGMIGNIIGSERCLSSCTHACQPSDVPAVHLPEHHLPVLVPSFWPLHGTLCFHLNHQGVSGSPTSTTCTPLHLFGRLAYCRPLSGSHPPCLIKDYSADAGVGLHYQCREVFPHSISKPNVPGSLGQSHLFHRSLYSPGRVCPSVPLISITSSSSLASSSGFHGKPGGHCAMVQDAYAPTPTSLALPLSSSEGCHYQAGPSK